MAGSLFLFASKKGSGSRIEALLNFDAPKIVYLLAHFWGAILVIYIWFITFGTFTEWTHTSQYYSRLANAFEKGQLHIDLSPGTLLTAPDPYDPQGRAPFQDEIWDMSYYQGKLYYYFGPLPSLVIVPIQSLLDVTVKDSHLVFCFFAALLIINSLIILKLWRRYFSDVPAWTVFLCILLIGLILPILWETSVPYVYEVAVGAGQFFLMGGIYFIISAFDRDVSIDVPKLFLGGLFWAASVGSRAINVFAVIFLALWTSFLVLKTMPQPLTWKKILYPIAALYLPLIFSALIIGWYNWMRFDSPFEFGIRYMITTYNLNERSAEIFQLEYLWPNLYVYLVQPFRFIEGFPFIEPMVLPDNFIEVGSHSTRLYYAGRMVGMLFCMPFLGLGLFSMVSGPVLSRNTFSCQKTRAIDHFIIMLAGSGLIGFVTLLFYFNAQTRFLVDVISQFTLLAILGYWMLIQNRMGISSKRSRLAMYLATLLLILTIIIGFLLSVTSETGRLETFNPLLIDSINNFLRIRSFSGN